MSPEDIARLVRHYANRVTYKGPRERATAFRALDLCRSYGVCVELAPGLWVLFETNDYGLTPRNLDLFWKAGIDAFWLNIKAYDGEVHRRLTGASNEWVLILPEEILKRGFTLEVLYLYIPGWVESNQRENRGSAGTGG